MAIYSQNEGGVARDIDLQGTSDTNPTITTENLKATISMTTGYDALWTFKRKHERQSDGPPATTTVLQSKVYGYNGHFSNQSGTATTMYWNTWRDVPDAGQPSGFLPANSNKVDTSSVSNIGSLSSYSFTSNISNTITALCWGDHIDGSTPTAHNNVKWVVLALDGAYNFYNTDATFKYLTIQAAAAGADPVQLNRSDATFSTGENGDSTWCWLFNTSSTTAVDNLGAPGSGSTREVKFYNEESITYKTGIAEEMGGADSADVKMSDYYKAGTFHNTSGIPESGAISMSDFYGKTFVSTHLAEGSFTRNYNNFGNGVFISGLSTLFQAGGSNVNAFDFQGVPSFVYAMQNASGDISLQFKTQGQSANWSTSGTHDWNVMKVWAASTPTGTPLITLNRSDADTVAVGSNNTVNVAITYTWNGSGSGYSASTYFGTVDGASAYYLRVGRS